MSRDRFVAFTNLWLMRENTMTDATSTLAGPIVGCRCRVCWMRAPSSSLSRTSPVGSMTAVMDPVAFRRTGQGLRGAAARARPPRRSGLPADAGQLAGVAAGHAADRAVGVELGAGVEEAEARRGGGLLARLGHGVDRLDAQGGHLAGELGRGGGDLAVLQVRDDGAAAVD